MKRILEYIWQLPQNLCGVVYKSICKGNILYHDLASDLGANIVLKDTRGSVSLGKYVFIYSKDRELQDTIIHELGHVKQSKILGPLYLIVIGIPSILHCWYNDFIDCCRKDGKYHYEHFYTEAWAEKLMEKEKKEVIKFAYMK